MKKLLSILLAVTLVVSLAAFASAAVGDNYNAVDEFDTENADGSIWEYVFGEDGAFDYLAIYNQDAWRAGYDPDIEENGGVTDWSGVGISPNHTDYIELNTFNTTGALVFVAPNDGFFKVNSFVAEFLSFVADWGHSTDTFVINDGEDDVLVLSYQDDELAVTIPDTVVDMSEGDKLYFYHTGHGSVFADVIITEVEEPAEDATPVEDETEPGDVLPIAMVIISAITAGGALTLKRRK